MTKEYPPSVVVGSMDSEEYTMPAVNWISHSPEPLLYVKKDEIPQETVDALKIRGGKANIYLLGPESVVSPKVQSELGQYGKVVRIAGEDCGCFCKIQRSGHRFRVGNHDAGAQFLIRQQGFRRSGSGGCSVFPSGQTCAAALDR
ncbi:cell wall-binding repeat-containing protein [Paenibacillus tyrfis]|uniref:cell wall-binding repeat-containing protein n=1 Tax=Paenibacillus tyrfis TaxID=1501230 RepID=UPI00209DC6AD|nr:cell wall-binding repeat-containing protein [Paenibacillus tyrfis]MCP1307472.1 hypothetical protein [Paenibacillus tyrfis]